MIYAGFSSFFGLGLEDGHVPTFWLFRVSIFGIVLMVLGRYLIIRWMEEILHHLRSPKYCEYWGIRYIGWCKISSIHSSWVLGPLGQDFCIVKCTRGLGHGTVPTFVFVYLDSFGGIVDVISIKDLKLRLFAGLDRLRFAETIM